LSLQNSRSFSTPFPLQMPPLASLGFPPSCSPFSIALTLVLEVVPVRGPLALTTFCWGTSFLSAVFSHASSAGFRVLLYRSPLFFFSAAPFEIISGAREDQLLPFFCDIFPHLHLFLYHLSPRPPPTPSMLRPSVLNRLFDGTFFQLVSLLPSLGQVFIVELRLILSYKSFS